jgi:hypothetical protein
VAIQGLLCSRGMVLEVRVRVHAPGSLGFHNAWGLSRGTRNLSRTAQLLTQYFTSALQRDLFAGRVTSCSNPRLFRISLRLLTMRPIKPVDLSSDAQFCIGSVPIDFRVMTPINPWNLLSYLSRQSCCPSPPRIVIDPM